jgi:hypothetical protein
LDAGFDVDDLAAHPDGRVEDAAQHAHTLQSLERTGLYTNGFRVLGGASSGSTMRQSTPRRASSIAAVMPIGPAPAISTCVSEELVTAAIMLRP